MMNHLPDPLGRRAVLRTTGAAVTLGACASAARNQDIATALGALAVSPDGGTVAFQFSLPFWDERGGPRRAFGLGLYAWRTGALRRIPNPPGVQLGHPSYAPDGRRLVCLNGRLGARDYWQGVSVVELPGLAHREAVPNLARESVRTNVVVQPGTGDLLFGMTRNTTNTELVLHPATGGARRVVLPAGEGPRYVDSLAFAGAGEVLFQGISAEDPGLVAQLAAVGLGPLSTALWRLPLGGRPVLLFPRTREEAFPPGDSHSVGGVAASRDGAVVLTVARSRERPTGPRGEFYYEVFRLEADGRPTALTCILGVPNRIAVAYGGSVAAFLEDPSRSRRPDRYDLWTLDLRTHAVTATGLLQRVRAHPGFATA